MSEKIFPRRNRAFRQDDSIYVTEFFRVIGNAEPELAILQSYLTPELGVSHREDLSSQFTTAIRRSSRQLLPQENRIDGQIKLGLQAHVGFPTSHVPEREAIVFIRANRSDHTLAVNLPWACLGRPGCVTLTPEHTRAKGRRRPYERSVVAFGRNMGTRCVAGIVRNSNAKTGCLMQ
jgi:hypothetical protein